MSFVNEIASILVEYNGEPDLSLVRAAERGDLRSVRVLLAYGVDPQTRWGYIPNLALKTHNLALLKYLIEEKGLKPTNSPFTTPICYMRVTTPQGTVEDRVNREAMSYFMNQGYKLSDVSISNCFYFYHTGTLYSQILRKDDLQYLVDNHIDTPLDKLQYKQVDYKLPVHLIHEAYLGGNKSAAREAIKFLLTQKVDTNFTTGPIDNKWYRTPLLVAIGYGDTELARAMLEAGANPNLAPDPGITPLNLAIKLKNKDLITSLLEYGAI